MIYKFDKGGIIKLQNAGSIPEYNDIEQIAKYNREHGTNFWKMSQVLEHDKQQAQRKTQDEKKSFWKILAGHPESAGEAILNKTIETANNTELPETRKKIYSDTAKSELGTTVGSLLTIPMLGEFSTYGLLGGTSRLAGGFGGSAVGSYTLGKAGEAGDKYFGTTWMKPTGQIVGGFAGWMPGSNIAWRGAAKLAPNRIIGDFVAGSLNKTVNQTHFIPAQVKYYGPTMGKSYAAKTNPNLIDLDTWGRSEYDQLAKKYGYKDWREMILSDKGDYNEEYKQLIKDQIRRIQSDPQYSGKTIVVSNASLLKPNSGITFANTPVIPERSVMAARNTARHPWESIEHGEEWWDSLQRKGTPLRIDNRFISDIEGNKAISFAPAPQKFVSTVHFDPRVKPLSRPISEAEIVGIPKSMRSNPKSLEDPYYWGYKQWNSRYNAAISSGNVPEAQRLRALHFIIKALNTKVIEATGMPKEVYHFTNTPSLHKFDRKYKYDGQYPIYFTSDVNGRSVYMPSDAYQKSKLKVYLKMDRPLKEDLNKTKRTYDQYDLDKTMKTDPIDREEIRKFWRKKYDDLFDLSTSEDLRASNPKEAKRLFRKASDIWFNNIHNRYGKNFPMKQSEIFDLSLNKNFESLLEQEFQADGVIHNVNGTTHYITYKPEFIKFSKIMTYDDNGNLIPIVKRDNFHNLDMRYKSGGILKAQK